MMLDAQPFQPTLHAHELAAVVSNGSGAKQATCMKCMCVVLHRCYLAASNIMLDGGMDVCRGTAVLVIAAGGEGPL